MKGDFTRSTFRAEPHYNGVRMQQGRVLLDAEFNEHEDIQAHLRETEGIDVIGPCGAPQDNDGFEIGVTADGTDLTISPGRIYVEGILCEMEEQATYSAQPDYPDPVPAPGSPELQPGKYFAYLDVWKRHISALEDPYIREIALGGPDTTTRSKTITQVKLLRAGNLADASINCLSQLAAWDALTSPSNGQMRARAEPGEEQADPCIVPPSVGFRGLENQLYRVEVHRVLSATQVTVKWSRENGSIVVAWEGQDSLDPDKLTVSSAGKDKALGFAPDNWVELTDDGRELRGEAGLLVKVLAVDGNVLTIDPASQTVNRGDFPLNPKVRRWDMPGDVGETTVDLSIADNWLDLESGVQVSFEPGTYRTGDYWVFPARTATGDIEWPRDETTNDPLPQPPHGVQHHYCRLALLSFDGTAWSLLSDCRSLFPPLTELERFLYVGGDGQEAMPGDELCSHLEVGLFNGKDPVGGRTITFEASPGGGTLVDAANPANTGASIQVVTDANGIAACRWQLGSDAANVCQRATAMLLDAASQPSLQPIHFNANLSIASRVANITDCAMLAGEPTVQDALNRLCENSALYYVGGDGQEGAPGEELCAPLEARLANGRVPVEGEEVVFEIELGAGGVLTDVSDASNTGAAIKVATDANGMAACRWQLAPDLDVNCQRVKAYVSDFDQLPLFFNASLSRELREPGVTIKDVVTQATNRPLVNDRDLPLSDLVEGIRAVCNQEIDPRTISHPTCFVTVEFPFFHQGEILVGFQPIVLLGEAGVGEGEGGETVMISWAPRPETFNWLQEQLKIMTARNIPRLLARLTIKGNFIWARTDSRIYLDGEAFGALPDETPTGLRLPSGDGRRGGDFEMWFWLVEQASGPALVVVDDVANTFTGVPIAVNVLANDSGASPLTIISTTQPVAGGSVSISRGIITYVPPGGFSGTDTLNYTVQDSIGNTGTARVIVTVIGQIVGDIPPRGGVPTFPVVDFSVATLTKGTTASIAGSGFQPNESVSLLAITGENTALQIGNVTADEQGNVQADIPVSDTLPTGNFTVRAAGQSGSQATSGRIARIRNPRGGTT